ncbi:hypothetical protein HanXRQr2_Chr17g0815071 [Helianthus annuus]|uniref:Uncharacterized protein n=1 Tax=Helianthus annuus TaxID=4232 RepID=A0A251RSF8_HELAN|nr:hypothetical protein HanXRQr2_Chr17g0815071 [Helianthus annuus]KAJ0429982.1 hypothetical protein HanHA300_Chr17g0663711 [Helianthus annuus]KAJ0448418.1 hypothetical protein HanHA89_Chr17g0716651 [Helianthus annuus]KAJ0633305.1 hypothetical protein HanLR1_Chr17g0675181 [Helianthus annuus]KAJ0814194.1 hypothetical protein HanPSC8_Chr17g0782731 [Helianthus annuus]
MWSLINIHGCHDNNQNGRGISSLQLFMMNFVSSILCHRSEEEIVPLAMCMSDCDRFAVMKALTYASAFSQATLVSRSTGGV